MCNKRVRPEELLVDGGLNQVKLVETGSFGRSGAIETCI